VRREAKSHAGSEEQEKGSGTAMKGECR